MRLVSGGLWRGSRAVHELLWSIPCTHHRHFFAQLQDAVRLVMSPHPAELGCVSSVTKPADGAPAHGELLRRRLESWVSLGRQRWR